jgi:hypothetical protein
MPLMESVMRTNSEHVAFFLTLACLVVLGWVLQTHILLNWDVSWLLHTSEKLLAGGTYANDFFELNPPLILYLYTPALFFSKIFSISIIAALRFYVFLLGSVSLFLCDGLIRKIFSAADRKLRDLFLVAIASTFFILPIEQFGQREHLLLLLALPYLLAIPYRLAGNKLNNGEAILIGLFAGLGFAIKPYFLTTLVLSEIYYLIKKRDAFAWSRTEVITIIAVFVVYLIVVFTLHRDYLFTVLPLAGRLYYVGVGQPLEKLASNPAVFTCYIAGLFHLWQYKNPAYASLRTVLFIALSGLLTSYFIQQTVWFSHLLPAFSVAVLLLVLEFVLFARVPKLERSDAVFFSAMILFIGGLIAYYHTPLRVILIFQPLNFFCYFAVVFTGVFYIAEAQTNVFETMLWLVVILGVSYLFTNLLLQSDWYPYRFMLTVCMLMLLFVLLVPRTNINKLHATAIATLGVMLFSYSFYYINYLYASSIIKKGKMLQIIHFLDIYAYQKPVDFFASSSFYTYPSVDYASATPSSRFQFLGWVADILKKSKFSAEKPDTQLIQDRNALIAMLADDLNAKQPAFVFVDAWPHKQNIEDSQFDFISYFLQDAKFQTAWKSYRYFTTLNDPTMYKFIVYKRVNAE